MKGELEGENNGGWVDRALTRAPELPAPARTTGYRVQYDTVPGAAAHSLQRIVAGESHSLACVPKKVGFHTLAGKVAHRSVASRKD